MWCRDIWRCTSFLDWRIQGQALPRGAAPLMAFGGRIICGQYWTIEEVEEFIATLGWQAEEICVFEYTRSASILYTPEDNPPNPLKPKLGSKALGG